MYRDDGYEIYVQIIMNSNIPVKGQSMGDATGHYDTLLKADETVLHHRVAWRLWCGRCEMGVMEGPTVRPIVCRLLISVDIDVGVVHVHVRARSRK